MHFLGKSINHDMKTGRACLKAFFVTVLFYFWPKPWTKEYRADASVTNIYSMYWLQMSHTLFTLRFSLRLHWSAHKMITGSCLRCNIVLLLPLPGKASRGSRCGVKRPAKVPRRYSDVNDCSLFIVQSREMCVGPVAFDRNLPVTAVSVLSNLRY